MADEEAGDAREVEHGGHRREMVLAVDQVGGLGEGGEVVDHRDGGRAQGRGHPPQARAEGDGGVPARQQADRQLGEVELGAGPLVERAVGQQDPQGRRASSGAGAAAGGLHAPSAAASGARCSRKRMTSR